MADTASDSEGTAVIKTKQKRLLFMELTVYEKIDSNSNKPIYWKINISSVTTAELKALYQST